MSAVLKVSPTREKRVMTRPELLEILESVRWVPSGDNCQPWKIRVMESKDESRSERPRAVGPASELEVEIEVELEQETEQETEQEIEKVTETETLFVGIIFQPQRARHALDYEGHASLLSLGALIEIMAVSAAHFGWMIRVTLAPRLELSGPSEWARISFESKDQTPSADERLKQEAQYSGLALRRTDRRPFQNEFLTPDQEKALLEALSEVGSAPLSDSLSDSNSNSHSNSLAEASSPADSLVRFVISSRLSPKFFNYLIDCDQVLWTHENIVRDFLEWVRFSQRDLVASRDGMGLGHLGVTPPEGLLLRLCRRWPRLPVLLWPLGFGGVTRLKQAELLRRSGGFVAFSVQARSPEALVEGGRRALKAWLLLNSWGYGVQPLSLGSLGAFDFLSDPPPAYGKTKFIDFYRQSLALWQEEFKLGKDTWPLWLFRFGKPRGSAIIPAPPRLALAALIESDEGRTCEPLIR